MLTKEEFKNILKENVVEVLFTKTDGSDRKMTCTLKNDVVVPYETKNTRPAKQENENVLPVWDIQAKGFRSFRLSSIKDYSVLPH